MRLWSLHPGHLDRAGLVAAWREALLAQAVLADQTTGYRGHPQLVRFRDSDKPLVTIGAFLAGLHAEAVARGYNFNGSKILTGANSQTQIPVTTGQLDYEWQHLGAKLLQRSPADAQRWEETTVSPHPLFFVVPGSVEPWERT
ncbi:hypothetical protein SAMN06309944_1083 [Micrococcales bacterium KH10]|nr:hypothetical protein SAMN06309944_1083 [Micrococcales bacterium KH10]